MSHPATRASSGYSGKKAVRSSRTYPCEAMTWKCTESHRDTGAASAFDEGLRVLDGADPVLEEQLTAGYLGAARLDFRTRETAQTRFRDLLAGSTEAATPAQRELLAQRALEHAMQGNAPAIEVVELIRLAHAGGELLRMPPPAERERRARGT